MLRLDHVMYVVRDLDAAARRVRFELGLDSYPGGEHVGVGTHNRIVPLGGSQYVELMAVKDEVTAMRNPVGRRVAEWACEGEGLRAWCVATDDAGAVAARLRAEPLTMSRALPDGGELRWRLVGVDRALANPSLPFFIEWSGDEHPAGVAVDHTVEPLGIACLEIGGDADRIAAWTDGADLPIRVVDADEGPRRLEITTSGGEILLR
jgi:hypothetical protein